MYSCFIMINSDTANDYKNMIMYGENCILRGMEKLHIDRRETEVNLIKFITPKQKSTIALLRI